MLDSNIFINLYFNMELFYIKIWEIYYIIFQFIQFFLLIFFWGLLWRKTLFKFSIQEIKHKISKKSWYRQTLLLKQLLNCFIWYHHFWSFLLISKTGFWSIHKTILNIAHDSIIQIMFKRIFQLDFRKVRNWPHFSEKQTFAIMENNHLLRIFISEVIWIMWNNHQKNGKWII